jgi:hypothetical protein
LSDRLNNNQSREHFTTRLCHISISAGHYSYQIKYEVLQYSCDYRLPYIRAVGIGLWRPGHSRASSRHLESAKEYRHNRQVYQ